MAHSPPQKLPSKSPIDSQRMRRIPSCGFSWIDRRFVREGWIERFPPETTLFYFFLVSVSDAQGLSFYADATVVRLLNITHEELSQARARLRDAALILYSDPLYQVLALPEPPAPPKRPQLHQPLGQSQGGESLSLREIFALAQLPASSTADPSGHSEASAAPRARRRVEGKRP